MFRFLHAADTHIDSPLDGLEAYDGAPVEALRGATRRAFENLVALALDEQVDFVLLAGDVYDGDWKDFSTGLFFSRQMARLNDAGIQTKFFADIYIGAPYLPYAVTLAEEAIRGRLPKRVSMHILYDKVGRQKLVNGWVTGQRIVR